MFRIPLSAQPDFLGSQLLFPVLIVVATGLTMFVVCAVLVKHYKRCPPNRIMVIYGMTGRDAPVTCLHGGARLVVPLLQDYGWLSLEPIRIEVSRQRTASGKMISDPLPRVFSVAIGTTWEMMPTAAIRLLGLTADEIREQAEDIIVARLDALIDAIDTGEVRPGTDEFYQRLESSIGTELNKLGLVLINFRRE